MQIEKLSEDKNRLSFILKDTNHVFANTLRRLMLIEVPVMAIDEVKFHKNDSALYDEIIALRLGLVPILTDLKSYKLKENCSCKDEGCGKCQLNFILNCKGPCTVYARDLKSQDPKISVILPDLPIVTLLEGQELELEATAILGKGKNHVKFSPGLIYFKAHPTIETNGTVSSVKGLCPKDILEIKNGKVVIKDLLKCDLCEICAEKNSNISLKTSEKDFIFIIESWGQLSAKHIFLEALNVFEEKLEKLSKESKKIK